MPETTILLVEDDDMILAFARSVLHLNGYRVICAGNALEALRIVAELGLGDVDLLLTDIDEPTLGGVALVRRLRQLKPELRVLCMTSRPSRVIIDLGSGCKVIEKPFAYSALLASLDSCLPRARGAA